MAKLTEGPHEPMGARANCAVLSATRRRAVTADAKNAEIALPENGGSAKNGEASWGAMARERKQTTKIGGPLQSIRPVFDKTRVCFGGTGKVVGRKRGEMGKTWDVLTEKRGKNTQNGGVLGYRKVVLNCPRAVGGKRRAEGVRRGEGIYDETGREAQKNPRSHERTGRKGNDVAGNAVRNVRSISCCGERADTSSPD